MFSDDFLRSVGAVVVAGGQVEHQLQLLLLHVQGRPQTDSAPKVRTMTWGPLVKEITKLAPNAPNGDAILAELARARRRKLEARRHQVVHTEWRFDGRGVRHPRGGESGFFLLGSTSDFETTAAEVQDFATRLMDLLPPVVPSAPHIQRARLTSVQRPPLDD